MPSFMAAARQFAGVFANLCCGASGEEQERQARRIVPSATLWRMAKEWRQRNR